MIEVSHLSKVYGANRAVDNISFSIKPGEIIGFLGPNGAGKSTTMNMITGYISSTSGSIKIDGIDILENPAEAKKRIGYLPEIPPLYLDMTLDEYLAFVYELKGVTLSQKNPFGKHQGADTTQPYGWTPPSKFFKRISSTCGPCTGTCRGSARADFR